MWYNDVKVLWLSASVESHAVTATNIQLHTGWVDAETVPEILLCWVQKLCPTMYCCCPATFFDHRRQSCSWLDRGSAVEDV